VNGRTVVFLSASALFFALGVSMVLLGITLPQDISLFSRYNHVYEGQTNIVTLIGFGMLFVSLDLLLYWVFTHSKKWVKQKEKTEQFTFEPEKEQ
jgi:uncharacterized membrane protein